jgi:CheY-like chemotaxis protein
VNSQPFFVLKSGNAEEIGMSETYSSDSFYRKAMEAGCDDLINKPFDFDKLQPVLEQYLAQ